MSHTATARYRSETAAAVPREIAPGVYWMAVGKGLLRSNIYFVRSGASWVLIDAASAQCGPLIQGAAESLFGKDSPPASILLTHDHPDHAGAARELARLWKCSVWVHPAELPLVVGDVLTFHKYSNPLDRWVILPLLRLLGPARTEAMVSQASFKDVARPLDLAAELPGLADWEVFPTPGHTPGHVAFFRRRDRVLITGDALVTLNLNSMWSLLRREQRVSGPPWYTTWNWRAAKESAAALAELDPLILAPGHGIPMAGREVPRRVRVFSERMGRAGR
jgi:glyoxylase-like metal-dependent hydrolase (beta-lactamase superfamily II)